MVLTYGYWQRRFGGAENVIGQLLEIDGTPSEIIGVLPSSFRFLGIDAAVLLPMQLDRANATYIEFDFQALARLKPGATLAQANADVARMISLLPPVFARLELRPNVRPLVDDVIGNVGEILWILLAAVGVVLLIACGNVANLFLVRAEGRQQELAMRAALGASRGRIARGLLSESVLLGLAGGALGLVLAQAGIGLLRRIAPAELPRVDEIGIDPMVLLFALVISVLTGVLFGLTPVLRFGTPNATALKEGGRSASDAPGRHRTRNGLVVSQIALALVLLIVSGLMIRTFVAMRQVDPGFTRRRRYRPSFSRYQQASSTIHNRRRARSRVSRNDWLKCQALHPLVSRLPSLWTARTTATRSRWRNSRFPKARSHHSSASRASLPDTSRRWVTGWSQGGQSRGARSTSSGQSSSFPSRSRARYRGEPARALGKRVRGTAPDAPWREVVGVVGGERDDGLNQPPTAIVYWPMLNESYRWRTMAYAVRSSRVGAPGFLRELQQAVWSVNSNLPLAAVQTLEEIRAVSMAQTSFAMVMLAIAASVALLIGIVGIYGVIAYVVTERTREVGIRVALGAQTGDVRRLFLRQGLALTMTGIAFGTGAAMLLTRVMSSLLFGVGPMDPATYVAVAASLAAVAMVATYLPARRASRVDPVVALRADV